MLAVADLSGSDVAEVRAHIVSEFEIEASELDGFEVLIAVELSECYESASWYLLRKDGQLYENHGGHCSCNGYEGQWGPEVTTAEYLVSDKFDLPVYSYGMYGEEEDPIKVEVFAEIAEICK